MAANLLDTALSSGDETVILGALGSLTSVPVAARRHWDQVQHHSLLHFVQVAVPSRRNQPQTLKIAPFLSGNGGTTSSNQALCSLSKASANAAEAEAVATKKLEAMAANHGQMMHMYLMYLVQLSNIG